MKRRTFLFLVAAAAVAAVLAWSLQRTENLNWQQGAVPEGARILGDFPVNDVAAVIVSGPDGTVTLRRGESGWGVGERSGYPADFGRVSAILLDLSELRALQSLPVAEADRGALSLRIRGDGIPRKETGTLVELKNATGKVLAALVLGKMHLTTPQGIRPEIGGSATARYVMPPGPGGRAYLVSETFSDLPDAPSAWIDRSFVRPGLPRRIEVRSKDARWVLTREAAGAPWRMDTLRKGQSLDASKAMSVDPMFTGMALADVPVGPEDPRVRLLADNPVTVTADTFDGLRYVLTIGRGDGDTLPVTVAAEPLRGEADPATDEGRKARAEKLAAADRFRDKVVFIPRNFLEPFLGSRNSLIAKPAAGN